MKYLLLPDCCIGDFRKRGILRPSSLYISKVILVTFSIIADLKTGQFQVKHSHKTNIALIFPRQRCQALDSDTLIRFVIKISLRRNSNLKFTKRIFLVKKKIIFPFRNCLYILRIFWYIDSRLYMLQVFIIIIVCKSSFYNVTYLL